MLGTQTRENLQKRLKKKVQLLGTEHKKILKKHQNKFEQKKGKLNQLIQLRSKFNPEFSMIPLAKQMINPQSQISAFKIEQIVETKRRKAQKENRFIALMNSNRHTTKRSNTKSNRKKVSRKMFLSTDLCGQINKLVNQHKQKKKKKKTFENDLRSRDKERELESQLFLKGVLSISNVKQTIKRNMRKRKYNTLSTNSKLIQNKKYFTI